jgi:hypothetical protein
MSCTRISALYMHDIKNKKDGVHFVHFVHFAVLKMYEQETARFMQPRRSAYNRIALADRKVAPLPDDESCASAKLHALSVCSSKLALANWLDALPFPLMEKAIHNLALDARVHTENLKARAMLETETFDCHVCETRMPRSFMDSHIAAHTCEMDRVATALPYTLDYEPPF